MNLIARTARRIPVHAWHADDTAKLCSEILHQEILNGYSFWDSSSVLPLQGNLLESAKVGIDFGSTSGKLSMLFSMLSSFLEETNTNIGILLEFLTSLPSILIHSLF